MVEHPHNSGHANSGKTLAVSFGISLAFAAILFIILTPRWETNDDVGMSMVAHGYGMAAVGLPNLIFSNVLWGYFVRAIPAIHGVLGYSTVTIGAIVISGSIALFVMLREGVQPTLAVLAFTLLVTRPLLFPQFTLNAGLLVLAGVLLLIQYTRDTHLSLLICGCIMAFAGYLVRDQQFFLMIVIAAPLIRWKKLINTRASKTVVVLFLCSLMLSAIVNRQAYEGPQWRAFNDLNLIRAPFTDFGAGAYLKERTDILASHGYTKNDVALLEHWFFVDPDVANPVAMKQMLSELGTVALQENGLANVAIAIRSLWTPTVLPLMLIASALLWLIPSRRLWFSWGLFLLAVIAMGLLGRPGVLRVYTPLVSLLIIVPLLSGAGAFGTKRLIMAIMFAAALLNASTVVPQSRQAAKVSAAVQRDLTGFPHEPVVVWGDGFPYEDTYPVLGASAAAMSYRLYGLGVFTLAPFSIAYTQRHGNSMTNLFMTEAGVQVIASDADINLLNTYCREHAAGKPALLSSQAFGNLMVRRIKCDAPSPVKKASHE